MARAEDLEGIAEYRRGSIRYTRESIERQLKAAAIGGICLGAGITGEAVAIAAKIPEIGIVGAMPIVIGAFGIHDALRDAKEDIEESLHNQDMLTRSEVALKEITVEDA